PDVNEVFDTYGSDAMRWFLMSSPVVRGGNLVVKSEGIRDTVRHVILPLWNIYYFFALYAGSCNKGAGYQAKALELADPKTLEQLGVMDRYLLARTRNLALNVKELLDSYDIPGACDAVSEHLDLLTNWYVRTSRDRFWNEEAAAYDTLYTCLEVLMRVMAPLAPLVSEEIWRGLTGGESVHLCDYPVMPDTVDDPALVSAMDMVREVVSATHSLRKTHNLRVRQPLQSLTVVDDASQKLADFSELIAGEVNVKQVVLQAFSESGLQLQRQLKLNPKAFAPEIRKATSQLFKAQKTGQWREEGENVVFPEVLVNGEPVALSGDQFSLSTTVEVADGQVATVLGDGGVVVLDTEITPELEAEGYARDLVRSIQDERKSQDLHVSDRIELVLEVPAERVQSVETHAQMIAHEVLATEFKVQAGSDDAVKINITAVHPVTA
ncbi:MAG: class I tRNA ligase family protein, partial [Varibaculum cambriense]|nr:class I tRNA ligase family protein [Varibaculum cambriense]